MEYNTFLSLVYSMLLLTGRTLGLVETLMSSQQTVCEPVAGIFGPMDDGGDSTERGLLPVQQGIPGGVGPPGNTGNQGPRGKIDYEKVSRMVEEKITAPEDRLLKIGSDIDEYKSHLKNISGYTAPTVSPEEIQNEKECLEKYHSTISYGTKCYTLIGGEGLSWTFQAAESNCTKLGGYPADLTTKALYDKIYDYVDKTYSTAVQAWTGMRYEGDKLLPTDGKQVEYSKWMRYYPKRVKTSYTSFYKSYTYVHAEIDTSSRINGLMNIPGNRKLQYAICQFEKSATAPTRRSTTTQLTTTKSYDYYDSDYSDYY